MKRELSGMRVVITGASSGIGRALAVQLHARGCRLLLSARRQDRLDALNSELGGGHTVVVADVAKPDDCAALIRAAEQRLGGVDTLVCNAGYGEMKSVLETDADALVAMFATNLIGTTECVRAAAAGMAAQPLREGWRGQVMIVSSGAARRGIPFLGVYSATKAAQLSVAEALRVELREQRIAVTSVHPVGTKTEFFDVAEQRGGRKLGERSAVDVQQTPEQVAAAMIKAIEKPRPEVWPLRPARWALSLATLFPRVADWMLGRSRGSK